MIPFEELCEALDRWTRQRELNGEPPIASRAAGAPGAPRRETRAAAAPAAPEPPPSAPVNIESQDKPAEDQTGEIDLEDVIDI